jgi:transposase-like protein
VKISRKNAKQKSIAKIPPLPAGGSPIGQSERGWCIQKYATAISPEAMNAAARVNNPVAIRSPATNSIKPAYQPGQAPNWTGHAGRTGQLKRSGVDPCQYRMNRKLTPAERARLAEEYRSGLSALQLARKYNIHRQTIARQLKREGVELREQRKRTLELTEQATKLYAEGRSLDEVAKLLGVQASTISRALKRAGVKLRPPVADRWHTSHDD